MLMDMGMYYIVRVSGRLSIVKDRKIGWLLLTGL